MHGTRGKKYAQFTDKSGINRYRSEISDRCMKQALKNIRLYCLTVPTGSGKTLSSLRFAVRHALEYQKRRIIYVAPYQSILDQNAEEIRRALDYPGIVLEHHCNIILETEEEQAYYDRVTEDWALPVIVTTAVQFLNTLLPVRLVTYEGCTVYAIVSSSWMRYSPCRSGPSSYLTWL